MAKMSRNTNRPSRQVVGTTGLYYVCYQLSKRGWNVLPTSRNARGVDVVVYSQEGARTHTIQVKTLSKGDPVPLGTSLNNLIADCIVICRRPFSVEPEIFIATTDEVKSHIHEEMKDGKKSYWLEPKDYEDFRDNWNIIGGGYD